MAGGGEVGGAPRGAGLEVGIRVDDLQQSSVGDALAGGAGQLLAEAAGQRGPGAAPGLRVAAAAVVGGHGRGAEAEGLQPFNFVQVRRLAPDGAVEVSFFGELKLRELRLPLLLQLFHLLLQHSGLGVEQRLLLGQLLELFGALLTPFSVLMGGPLHVPLVGAHRRDLRLELGDAVPLLGA